jgi:hypothetical protein
LKKLLLFILLTSLNVFPGPYDSTVNFVSQITAIKTTEHITIDGLLNETTWKTTPSVNVFVQRDPVEGAVASEKTDVYVAFDDEALYIAARMYDSHPDSIIARLTRRDNVINADRLLIYLDPYHDKRSGYYFTINAAGILTDGVLYNDDWDDNSWDAVWEGKAHIDDKGWTVEVRIPFTQMRFKNDDHQVWGINFKRIIARKNEEDYTIKFPKTESGFVSRFIELNGLDGVKPSAKVEVVPYITGKGEYSQHDPANPFNNGSVYTPGIGADLKMGIGNNLTLNATINPDFGQVEIDPAVINLSDVETYYNENRPFFTQGSSIFNSFGNGGARNFWSFNFPNATMFYSRRIGRNPQGSVPDNADFTKMPNGTHILGAAKLTGKIFDNWNIGAIQAVTQREYADYQVNGENTKSIEVEPLTYYGVARIQREINDGRQGIGLLATYTARDYKDRTLADITNKNSLNFGVDGWTSLDTSKTWVVTAVTIMSNLNANNQRMIELQESSQRYFQRPDAKNFHVDSSRTSLTGFAGRYYLIKQKGNSFFNSSFGFITPEFDCNDLGFLSRADIFNMHIGGGYDWTEPTSFYHYVELGIAFFRNYDFDFNKTSDGVYAFGTYQFTNFYYLNVNCAYNPYTINNNRTRGGPLTLNSPGWQTGIFLNSDDKKNIVYSFGESSYSAWHDSYIEYDLSVEYRPASNISISFSPFFVKELQRAMYIGTFSDIYAVNTFSNRYVFGELDQKTVGAGIRLNWTFTPDLSLQLYIQPLVSTGKYAGIKELAKPKSLEFNNYSNISYNKSDDTYVVDPDGSGPAPAFSFNNPDFNYKSLRGNAVLRWEYLPGSVFYFVWTQTRSDVETIGDFGIQKTFNSLLDIHPDNIFAIKFTYWLNM